MSEVRRSIPEVIINPDPSQPDLTLVRFGNFPYSYSTFNLTYANPTALFAARQGKAAY